MEDENVLRDGECFDFVEKYLGSHCMRCKYRAVSNRYVLTCPAFPDGDIPMDIIKDGHLEVHKKQTGTVVFELKDVFKSLF